MNRDNYTDLIVGGDSIIGAHLFESLLDSGRMPCKTSRREKELKNENMFFLDLSYGNSFTIPAVKASYLVAGVTSIAECEKEQERAYLINVTNMTKLAQHLAKKRSFTLYLSSSAVFDGTEAFCQVDSIKSPITEYGRQKNACENILLESISNLAIIRLGKVLGNGNRLMVSWIDALTKGKTITAFEDKFVAPVSLPMASNMIKQIGISNQSGIFHLSAGEEISYLEIARFIAEKLSIPKSRVKAQNCGFKNHATLDCSESVEKFGVKIPSPWEAIEYMLSNHCVTT